MKRLLIAILALSLAAPLVHAGRKTKKTGTIDDNVYTDSRYNFQLTSRENWSGKVNKEEEDARFRVIFTQKKPGIPAHFQETPHYTQTPRLVIFIDTSTLGIHPFVDSLMSETFMSDQKKEILAEFDLLTQKEVIPTKRSSLEFGGERGLIVTGRAPYTQEVATSPGSAGGRRVSGSYGGAIFGGKFGDKVFLAGLFCELDFFDAILVEAGQIVQSLEWIEKKPEEK